MKYDVFISYSHKDKAAADAVCASLEADGVRCWYAPRDIAPGQYDFLLRVSAPLRDEPPGGTPRRPVRFANAGMWNDGLKANAFGKVEVK